MRRLRFWFNATLLVVPVGLVGVGSYGLVKSVWNYLNTDARLAGLLSTEATRALGREVRIQDIHFRFAPWSLRPNRVELSGISIAQYPTINNILFAHADKVIVRFDLNQILFGKDQTVPLVDELQVIGPQVTLSRNAQGRWNFEQIFKPTQGGGRPFTGKVSFSNASLNYSDQKFPHPEGVAQTPFQTRLQGVAGVVQIRPDKSVAFDVQGSPDPRILRHFQAAGIASLKPLRIDARVIASRVNLPFFAGRFVPPAHGHVRSGIADVDISALYTPTPDTPLAAIDLNALDAHGTLKANNISLTGPQFEGPVDNANLEGVFTTDSFQGRASGQYAGVSISLQGQALGLIKREAGADGKLRTIVALPTLALQGQTGAVDIARVLSVLHLDRRLPQVAANIRSKIVQTRGHIRDLTFQIVGDPTNPTVSASGHVDTLRSFGYNAANVDARALLDKQVATADVRGKVEGGDVAARARVLTREPGTFDVEAHARNVRLAALSSLLKRDVAGQGELDLTMRGRRRQPPYISAQAQGFDIKLNKQNFHSLYARAATIGRNLVVRTIRLEDPKGFAFASGTVDLTTRQLKLNVAADNLDLSAILKAAQTNTARTNTPIPGKPIPPNALATEPATSNTLFDVNALQGQGFFRGRVDGTLGNPELNGRFSAFGVQAGQAGLDRIRVDFSASRDAVIVAKGTAERYPGKITFSGQVTKPLDKDPAVQLRANADHVDIPDLLRLAGVQTGLTNNISNNLPNTLTAKKPLDDYVILGSISTNPILLSGTFKSLRLAEPVTVTGNDVSVNGLPVENLQGVATLDNNNLRLESFGADIAGGRITATGSLSDLKDAIDGKPALSDVNASVSAVNLDVGKISDVLPVSLLKYSASGTLNAQVTVAGSLENPRVHATAKTTGVALSDEANRVIDIGSVSADATYADKQLTVRSLSVNPFGLPSAGGGQIEADQFVYDPQSKAIRGVIRWNGLEFQRVRELFAKSPFTQSEAGQQVVDQLNSLTKPLSGSTTGKVTVGGTTDEPTADLTFSASGIRIEDRAITSVTGSAFVTKKRLLIPSPAAPDGKIILQSPDLDLEVSKVDANFDRGKPDTDADARKLTAEARINKFNLGVIRQLVPAAMRQDQDKAGLVKTIDQLGGGGGTVILVASGTTVLPVIEASINLTNVAIHSPNPSIPDQIISRIDIAHMTVQEGKIDTDNIEIAKIVRDPKTEAVLAHFDANARGSIAFSWKPPYIKPDAVIEGEARVPEQGLDALAAFGQNLNVTSDGKFSMRATLSGTRDDPQVFGALVMSADKIQFGKPDTGMYQTGLKNLRGQIDFLSDRIRVHDGFTARTQVFDKNGKEDPKKASEPIQLSGFLPFKGRVDPGIRLVAQHLVFDETLPPGPRSSGKVTGEADVNLNLYGSLNNYTLGGIVDVANTTATPPGDFGGTAGGPLALPINPRFDLTVRLNKNVRVRTGQLNALAQGAINIGGRLLQDDPNGASPAASNPASPLTSNVPNGTSNPPQRLGLTLNGKLTIPEGSLTLPTARFTILPPGQLTLMYPTPDASANGAPTLGIDVDLRARTSLTATSISGIRKNYAVTVAARGPISGITLDPNTGESRLALNFTTDPNDLATNQQALQQRLVGVLGADALGQFGKNPGQVLAQQLTNVFTNAVIPGVFDQVARATGFEELAFNYDPVQHFNFIVSRQIVGPLYVRYTRTLGTTPEMYDLKLSLRFKNNYQISYEQDELNTQRYLFEGVFRF